jgi:hypothetical protein
LALGPTARRWILDTDGQADAECTTPTQGSASKLLRVDDNDVEVWTLTVTAAVREVLRWVHTAMRMVRECATSQLGLAAHTGS